MNQHIVFEFKGEVCSKKFFWAIDECRGHHSAENLKKFQR